MLEFWASFQTQKGGKKSLELPMYDMLCKLVHFHSHGVKPGTVPNQQIERVLEKQTADWPSQHSHLLTLFTLLPVGWPQPEGFQHCCSDTRGAALNLYYVHFWIAHSPKIYTCAQKWTENIMYNFCLIRFSSVCYKSLWKVNIKKELTVVQETLKKKKKGKKGQNVQRFLLGTKKSMHIKGSCRAVTSLSHCDCIHFWPGNRIVLYSFLCLVLQVWRRWRKLLRSIQV